MKKHLGAAILCLLLVSGCSSGSSSGGSSGSNINDASNTADNSYSKEDADFITYSSDKKLKDAVVGNWYSGKDNYYNYVLNIYSNGKWAWVQYVINDTRMGSAENLKIEGTYTIEDGIMHRVCTSHELENGNSIDADAYISFSEDGETMCMEYLNVDASKAQSEFMQKLSEDEFYSIYLGVVDYVECPVCKGKGTVGTTTKSVPNYTGGPSNYYEVPDYCDKCGGTGRIVAD